MIETERLDELISEVVEGSDTGNDGPLTRLGRTLRRGMGRWCEAHPLLCIVAGFGLLVLGGLSFLAATGQRSLPVAILLALAGPLVGAFGLLILNEPISRYATENPSRGRWIGILGLAAGAGLVWLAIARRSPTLAVVGAVVVLLGLLAINARLLVGANKNPGLLLLAGVVLLLVAPIMAWIGDGIDPWSIAAVVPWVVGLVLFKVGLPPWIDRQRDTRRVAITIDSILAVALGALLLLQASREFSEGALLFGLVLVVAGFSALGISIARFDPSRGRATVVLVVGLLAVGVGALLANGIIGLELATLVAVVVIGAVGAWFVFRGEALIAVLLLGFLLAWVLIDRITDEPLDPTPEAGSSLVLALGDSFISGEGAADFFEGTNQVGPNGNQCRRAPTAYPYLAAERLNADLIFLACSGAKATAIDGQPEEGTPDPLPEIGSNEDQVQRLLEVHGDEIDDVDLVLVSMGGNDVGFGTVIKACLLPQSCAIPELTEPWLRNVVESRKQLVASYLAIKEAVGDDTPVVAVLYPLIVEPSERCDLAIDPTEIDFVVRFTNALNDTVRASAAEAGINVFEGSFDAFAGRRLCDADPATNFFHLAPTNGPIQETIVPPNWVHGTLHPRADGHELIANRLVSAGGDRDQEGYLTALLDSVEAGGQANPAPEDGPGPGVPDYEDLPDEQWVEEQLYRTVGDLLLPVGLLLLGGLITAFGVIKARIPFLQFLNPSNN
ncbi:MAG: SGNH/GDSL hydrolase family protein [Acidimicrobiales bacterium]